MSRKLRTFIAVELSPLVCQRAAKLIGRLSEAGPSYRWVDTGQLHLTLAFLGEVDELEIAQVCRAAAAAAASQAAFTLDVGGAGAFPRLEQPRTVWLGVRHGAAELATLKEALEDRLQALGYPREARKFTPHVTLGRAQGEGLQLARLSALLAEHADYDAGSSEIEELVVFSSELTRQGPEYTALAHAALG